MILALGCNDNFIRVCVENNQTILLNLIATLQKFYLDEDFERMQME